MYSKLLLLYSALIYFAVVLVHGQFSTPPSSTTVAVGGDASFECTLDSGGQVAWSVGRGSFQLSFIVTNASDISGIEVHQALLGPNGPGSPLVLKGVGQSMDGVGVSCAASGFTFSDAAILTVLSTPSYSTLPDQSTTPLEGSSFSHSFSLSGDTSSFNWTKDGEDPSTDGRISTTASSIMIANVQRTDSGAYHVFGSNIAGTATASFVLDVNFSPEFIGFDHSQTDVLSSGSSFTFNCTPSAANPAPSFSFMRNGSTYTEPAGNINGPVLTISSVVRADTGNYSCTATNTAGSTTLYYNLLVVAPPQYSLKAGQSTTPLEGSDFTYQFNLDNGGVEPSFTWSRAGTGGDLMNGTKYTLTADSITVKNVRRDDSAMYTVSATNMAGSHSISFTLDVQYPPSLMNVNTSSRTLTSGQVLTIDCTPTPGNPSSTNVTFNFKPSQPSSNNGVLTISPVQRRHRGAYSCTASNGVGQDPSVTVQVDVFGPPTAPRSVAVSGEMSFSATAMWTAPEDSGLSSSFSSPSEALTYLISYNSSSSSTQSLVKDSLAVVLSNLQHSTNYTVSVEASNVLGTSPASNEVHFRTPDSKPILQAVDLAPLSLNNFTANVTFLTVGGQDGTIFSITINDSSPTVVDSTPVPDGKGVMVSLLIEGRSFTKGTFYSVEITATNSVGTSEPITGLLYLPNPPMITANFTEVSADDIPSTKCCAGLQLRLAEQPDVSDLKVLLTPQGGNQFTVSPADFSLAEGSVLYIGGLQTGTDYTAVVTVSNIFGSSDSHLQLKPLLGVPSNPNPPTVSVNGAGQVTVELSTAYPGTVQTRSGNMFSFDIQFIEDGQRSSRQSKTEMKAAIPASLFNTSAIFTTNLDPGSYSVSVTAVNEHGRSSAVMSQSTFTVTALPTPAPVSTAIIVAAVIVVAILTILITIILCIICFITAKKKRGTAKLGGKKSQTEPVYDELETDVHAGTLVEMHSNPAYDTAESVTTTDKPIPGPIGPADYEIAIVHSTAVGDSNVVLLENMAYDVIEDVKLPPTTTTTTPSAVPPTQSTPGGLESEYEVMYVKGAGSEEENYI